MKLHVSLSSRSFSLSLLICISWYFMLISGSSWRRSTKRQFHDSVSCCFCVIVDHLSQESKQPVSKCSTRLKVKAEYDGDVTLSELQACFLQGFLQLRAASAFLLQRRLQVDVLQRDRGHGGALRLSLRRQRCQQILSTPATKQPLHPKHESKWIAQAHAHRHARTLSCHSIPTYPVKLGVPFYSSLIQGFCLYEYIWDFWRRTRLVCGYLRV